MIIEQVEALNNYSLRIKTSDGNVGIFNIKPFLDYEAFRPLKELTEFRKVKNGGYFIEWECGADLSADTLEAKMKIIESTENPVLHLHEKKSDESKNNGRNAHADGL